MTAPDRDEPIDPGYLRRRAWRRLLASPLVAGPVVFGGGLLLLSIAGIDLGGYGVALGMASLVLGVVVGGVRRLVHFDRIVEEVRGEFQGQTTFSQYLYLHSLGRRLKADGDPRTRQHVRELRRLYSRLDRVGAAGPAGLRAEIYDKAGELYRSSIAALERTLEYRTAALEMSTDEARRQMVQARETLLAEVGRSIQHLGATLDHLQSAALRRDPTEENLVRVRDELVESLDVAKRVEEDMADLDRQLRQLE